MEVVKMENKTCSEIFSERLTGLRQQHNETSRDLARALDVSFSAISNYQLGKRTPDIVFLQKVARHYNVSTDYLLGLSDTKSTEQDMKIACELTGLSEKSMENLSSPYRNKIDTLEKENSDEFTSSVILVHCEEQLMVLNSILGSHHFKSLLAAISHALSSRERIEQWGKDAEIFLTTDMNPDSKISCETAYNAALLHIQRVISQIIEEEVTNNAKHNPEEE